VFSVPKPGLNGACLASLKSIIVGRQAPAPFFEKSLMKECQTSNVRAGACLADATAEAGSNYPGD